MTPAAHVRTIRVEATKVGPEELDVFGHLVDERPHAQPGWWGVDRGSIVHDMSLRLRVRHPDLTILAVEAAMTSRPYTVCADAIEPIQELVGLSVAQGFTRAVNARFGRQRGCAHITALIHAMAPVVRQGAGAAFRDEAALPRSDDERWFVNTCQAWREGGVLHQRLVASDIDALRALSVRPAPG